MADSVYRSMTGWRLEDARHPGTHRLLTNQEYVNLLDGKNRAVQDREAMKETAENAVAEERLRADKAIRKAEEKAMERLEEITRKLRAAEDECQYLSHLNGNLLRISRERANADRKLRPKKEHSGYTVIFSQEREIKYSLGKTPATGKIWETVIQSPYSVDFTEEQARRQIYGELLTGEGGWTLGRIGIDGRHFTSFDRLAASGAYVDGRYGTNVAFEGNLRANYRAGYWEYIVKHTRPLDTVPREMRV